MRFNAPLTVAWAPRSERDMARLDPQIRRRVLAAVRRFAVSGQGVVRSMAESPNQYRLRVGDWRVRFHHVEDSATIRIVRVGHRREVYRD